MPALFEAGVKLMPLLILLSGFQALLGVLELVAGVVSINNTHVVNTACLLHPEGRNMFDHFVIINKTVLIIFCLLLFLLPLLTFSSYISQNQEKKFDLHQNLLHPNFKES